MSLAELKSPSSPWQQAWINLFNEVHTPDAFLAGVDFAAVLRKRPARLLTERQHVSGRYAALSWPGSRRTLYVPLEALLEQRER
jgi:hypothetical protein